MSLGNKVVLRAVDTHVDQKELQCLADNIYYETRGSSDRGKIAVINVTFNRVVAFHKTICEVVYDGCQFSWVCYGSKKNGHWEKHARWTPQTIKQHVEVAQWLDCLSLASRMIIAYNNQDGYVDITGGALYYHNTHVKPSWRKSKHIRPITQIEGHIFYGLIANAN